MPLPCPPARRWRLADRTLVFPRTTLVMGILNATPDSFSDGGRHLDPERAVEAGLAMAAAGAHLLDVGGESTRPGADPVPPDLEAARVLPIIRDLVRRTDLPVSVDTRRASVARAALDLGARVVNDVSALADPEMAAVVARARAGVVLMHMKGEPRSMQLAPDYRDVVAEVGEFLAARLAAAVAAGIDPEAVALDPGIGFGKTFEHNLQLLRGLDRLVALGRPVLVGASRKAFLGRILDLPVSRRLEGTAAAVAISAFLGASIVRVHDVAEMARVAAVADAVAHLPPEAA